MLGCCSQALSPDVSITHCIRSTACIQRWLASAGCCQCRPPGICQSVCCSDNHLTASFPGQPGQAGTRKVKSIWILLEKETVSGSGISWAICKSATRSRQITIPAPHHSVFYRLDALPAAQPTASKHWRLLLLCCSGWHWLSLAEDGRKRGKWVCYQLVAAGQCSTECAVCCCCCNWLAHSPPSHSAYAMLIMAYVSTEHGSDTWYSERGRIVPAEWCKLSLA